MLSQRPPVVKPLERQKQAVEKIDAAGPNKDVLHAEGQDEPEGEDEAMDDISKMLPMRRGNKKAGRGLLLVLRQSRCAGRMWGKRMTSRME